MDDFSFEAASPEEMKQIGEAIAKHVNAGDVLALEGDLGAGKTTFTKGLAKGLGIKKTVNSPTFTIIKEYKGRIPLYHIDVYRLENHYDDLGFDEYFEGDGVTVVEWAPLIKDELPSEYLAIKILKKKGSEREITLRPIGARYKRLCKEIYQS